MTLSWSTSVDPGRWLFGTVVPWHRLVTFGPDRYEAYARLRFIPDPVRPGQAESDHDLPDDHPTDLEQARTALRVLAGFTQTPDDCWFAVWDGYPGSLDIPSGVPLLDVPHEGFGVPVRRYGLLHGRLSDLDGWENVVGRLPVPPAFMWPTDHRWCFACDVDPHWAGVGGEGAAVEALLAAPGLDAVRADPARRQPHF